MADIHIMYQAPVLWGTPLKAGTRTPKIGNKSITIEQDLENADTGGLYASGTVIAVAFDYTTRKTMSVLDERRKRISEFENI